MRRLPLLLVMLSLGWNTAAAQDPPRRPFLFKDARGELAAARARGDSTVLMVMAAMPGRNPQLASRIGALGGTIQFRSDDVDYLRARVPVDQVDVLVGDPALHSADISIRSGPRVFGQLAGGGGAFGASAVETPGLLPFEAVRRPMPADTPVWPPQWPAAPLLNPYNPLTDMNGVEFRRLNPTFDGRGVTLAMIDQSMDPLLPELQHALTLDGRPIHKIAAYLAVTDGDEEEEERWVRMDSVVHATGGTFTFEGQRYTAPADGSYRIGVLVSASLPRILYPDSITRGDTMRVHVLWNERTDEVRVDTKMNRSFADEKALTDFSVRPEFGVIDRNRPGSRVRESVGFGIQLDRERKRVAVNLGTASHASLVVGAAVASRMGDGRFDGVAPGSRVANVAEGGAAYGQTEAVIRAFQNPEVDGAWLEQSSLITRDYLLRDGRLVPTVIYARLIEHYGKHLMSPTHNYPVLGAPDDFVSARHAIGVGGHEGKANYFLNRGLRVEHEDNLLITGGYGPMGDGALKPDIISPSHVLSTGLGFEPGQTMMGLFTLPAGYRIAGGTSTATPTASGAVALLISAARQSGIRYDPRRIHWAVTRTGRHLPHLPVYKQGNGVINIGDAWRMLQALDTASLLVEIESRAPVRHVLSHLLPTAHEGVGLYERDGWNVGQREQRTVTYTRTTGPREPMTFRVGWIGNTGVFSAPSEIVLPLNVPTPIVVTVAPDSVGAHTALLTLAHPQIPGDAHRMMVAIVAAQPLDGENKYRHEKKVEVPRPGMHSLFYRVPAGTQALRVELETEPARRVALAITAPDTRAIAGLGATTANRQTFVVHDPMPGMWEIRLSDVEDTRSFDWEQALKDEVVKPTPATVRVSAIAAGFVAAPVSTASSQQDGNGPAAGAAGTGGGSAPTRAARSVTVDNRMAVFTGGVVTHTLGSARHEQPTIREKEQRVFEIDVPAGATMLVAQASSFSDSGADLDLYAFDCTGERCRAARADGNTLGSEMVRIDNPAAGRWKIVVDAHRVPAGSTRFDYTDVVFGSTYGVAAAADQPVERAIGASWTVPTMSWHAAPVGEGRVPYTGVVLEVQRQGGVPFRVFLGELR
jgi:hypothetical protein